MTDTGATPGPTTNGGTGSDGDTGTGASPHPTTNGDSGTGASPHPTTNGDSGAGASPHPTTNGDSGTGASPHPTTNGDSQTKPTSVHNSGLLAQLRQSGSLFQFMTISFIWLVARATDNIGWVDKESYDSIVKKEFANDSGHVAIAIAPRALVFSILTFIAIIIGSGLTLRFLQEKALISRERVLNSEHANILQERGEMLDDMEEKARNEEKVNEALLSQIARLSVDRETIVDILTGQREKFLTLNTPAEVLNHIKTQAAETIPWILGPTIVIMGDLHFNQPQTTESTGLDKAIDGLNISIRHPDGSEEIVEKILIAGIGEFHVVVIVPVAGPFFEEGSSETFESMAGPLDADKIAKQMAWTIQNSGANLYKLIVVGHEDGVWEREVSNSTRRQLALDRAHNFSDRFLTGIDRDKIVPLGHFGGEMLTQSCHCPLGNMLDIYNSSGTRVDSVRFDPFSRDTWQAHLTDGTYFKFRTIRLPQSHDVPSSGYPFNHSWLTDAAFSALEIDRYATGCTGVWTDIYRTFDPADACFGYPESYRINPAEHDEWSRKMHEDPELRKSCQKILRRSRSVILIGIYHKK